ncbi:MAG: arsenate reductase (glutaredoxin) [Flavobacteriaceae bacterium]|uniref:arsenate reductase (glutaredoxin) n=1 Tax=Bizionia echini TaxID=649333 RepID=UPI000C89A90B|nr:arsenate reductase (glutaredoxin) [Flavobacteriaceae bacterium]|tara:strand:- start:761 stop:1102 length:342 start_codon:yes stop_codon:yes gene_type:complete
MITIYHNNRCSKSRNGLQILKNSGKPFEVVTYLKDVPSENELKNIISLLGIKPIELVRKNEAIWKEQYKGTKLSDADLISAMVKNPKLIERPIVINGKQAVIGRPPEKILEIL